MLAAPVRFELTTAAPFRSGGVRFVRREPGTVEWESRSTSESALLRVAGALEFDGYLRYRMVLRATHIMGLGLKGQRRPLRVDWAWDVARKNQDGLGSGG